MKNVVAAGLPHLIRIDLLLTNSTDCPDASVLAADAEGELGAAGVEHLQQHLSSCDDCRELAVAVGSVSVTGAAAVATTAAADSSQRGLADEAPLGETIGRFEVVGELGRGGTGVVYEARDPTLNRNVAIKLVKSASGGFRADARDRLLQEARSLARLAHPNVVPIHQAGVHDGELFVAMELVDGESLEAWLETDRDWRDVVTVFALAGDGLAAAHGCELIHRDFKPSNVIVDGTDGSALPSVKVVDFGLARAASIDSVEDLDVADEFDSARVTRTGGFVGTPAYASPEQLLGNEASERSDIFSFSVALFEAFAGERPHRGGSLTELIAAIDAGPDPTLLKRVPTALRSIVASGLQAEPRKRPSSMTQFTAALRRAAQPRRARTLVQLAAGASVIGVIALVLAFRGGDEPPCGGAADELVGVWDISTHGALVSAMLESGSPVAAERARAVSTALGDYSRRWVSERTSACQANASAEQSSELRDLRFACYRRKLAGLRATTSLLSQVNEELVRRSMDVVGGLESLDECADSSRLLALETASPAAGSAAAEVDAKVSRAEALSRAGQIEDGLGAAVEASQQATALDDPRRISRANEALATLLIEAGEFDDGVEAYRTALFAAVASKDGDAEARIAGDLARELTFNRLEKSLASNYVDHARAALRRGVGAEAHATSVLGIAAYHFHVNELDESELGIAEVLEHAGQIEAPKQRQVRAAALSLKAQISELRGEWEVAAQSFTEARELYRDVYGHNHDAVASISTSLGDIHLHRGRSDEANAEYRAAWKIRETLAGDVNDLSRLQVAAVVSEDPVETERLHRKAVAAATRLFGANHQSTGAAHDDHSTALGELDRWREAEQAAIKAVEIMTAFEHAEPLQLAVVTLTLSFAQHETEQVEAALASAKRAGELITNSAFESSLVRVMVQLQLADSYTTLEQWTLACPIIDELAIEIPKAKIFGDVHLEFVLMYKTICQWELDNDRSAVERVAEAIEKLRGRDAELDLELPEVEAWLLEARRGKHSAKRTKR